MQCVNFTILSRIKAGAFFSILINIIYLPTIYIVFRRPCHDRCFYNLTPVSTNQRRKT